MKIAGMNNCIEKMRELYNFDDARTYIRLDNGALQYVEYIVEISTKDDNGTEIIMRRRADELVEVGGMDD